MTKMNDIKKMKTAELSSFVAEKRETLRTSRFGTGGSNSSAVRMAKKDVARALTELQTRSRQDKAVEA